jgi:hypothetical protein
MWIAGEVVRILKTISKYVVNSEAVNLSLEKKYSPP